MSTPGKRKIGIIDQTFRDAPQSLWASRISTPMMLPVAEKMDHIGLDYMDVGGAGAARGTSINKRRVDTAWPGAWLRDNSRPPPGCGRLRWR